MSPDSAAPEPGVELEPLSAQEEALALAAKSSIDSTKLILPALKLTQSLTAEVAAGDAEAGNYINSLTGDNYGDSVEIIISARFVGRFYSDRETGQSFVANGDTAPDNWPEEYAGQAFTDLPDGEEQWKAAVNAKEIPWGKGPPISTTRNYVGYVVSEDADPDLPVRLSLMRTGNKAADKLDTLLWGSRAPWDRTYVLGAERKLSGERPYFAGTVQRGSVPSPEYRQAAVTLAQEYATKSAEGGIQLAGDEPDAKKERPKEQEGGLKV